ncbi:dipeptide/oligopeptide/nickel ABC transporter permease/ATP-binding protein [Arthrobacter sp. GMC3]|uniref:dipeptide/oligopeptide/nickel ABC transporter permease/ATP-binding protein n=1 Tax=Arthrobacter sp. GMC3 TaxID=2058894 RepID=UPI000CE38F0E|nr:dipeptide/oligopeptide/nickel ABC transporter permease/ATP-binding protein [Arthrobacter sp. GMC3]
MSVSTTTDPIDARALRGWATLRRNPLFWISTILLSVIVIAGVIAPWISPNNPETARLDMINQPPSSEYWLGGDGTGRDVFSRLVFAIRTTLLGVAITVAVSAVIGLATGLVAGYRGGVIDDVLSWAANLIIVLPSMMVLIAMFAAIGPSVGVTMVVLGVILSPNFFRLVRNQTVAVRNELYVDAARVSGVRPIRIVFRHILRVILAPIVIMSASIGSLAIVMQAGLSFLGLGDASTPTWGTMLLDAFKNLYTAPFLLLWPGLMIAFTAGAFLLLANAIGDTVAGGRPPVRAPKLALAPLTPSPRGSRGTALLEIDGMSVAFAQADSTELVVVHDTTLSVERGEIVGIVGESGSGKSQTILATLGLLADGGYQRAGSVAVAGTRLASLSPRHRRRLLGQTVGYIPQEPMSNLDPSFTIGSQLTEPLREIAGHSRSSARKKALELLGRVGITDPQRVYDSYPHQISGGMAQRVLIAGAVACEPKLLIADEPTTALDVTVQAEILDLLRSLQKERGLGVLLVTHNLGVVADLCDRVIVMQDGQIRETGDVRQVLRDPHHPYTQSLLASTLVNAPNRGAWVVPDSSAKLATDSANQGIEGMAVR